MESIKKKFSMMGIEYNDPNGVDIFGTNRMNEILDMTKNRIYSNRDKLIQEILYLSFDRPPKNGKK